MLFLIFLPAILHSQVTAVKCAQSSKTAILLDKKNTSVGTETSERIVCCRVQD